MKIILYLIKGNDILCTGEKLSKIQTEIKTYIRNLRTFLDADNNNETYSPTVKKI